jgi:hypothetical protein
MRNAYTILIEKLEGKRPVGRVILKWILKKEDTRVWTKLFWLMTN